MMDPYYRFLESTWSEAQAMSAQSDVMLLQKVGAPPPNRYLLIFAVPYLRLTVEGTVEVAPGPVHASVYFPPDYLHSGDSSLATRVLTVDTPGFLHPNVRTAVCLGSAFEPGTPFRTLVSALYSVITYQVFCTDERNSLNPLASRLVREHGHLVAGFDRRPLVRRGATRTETSE
ncbi:MAG: hypothetical protein P4L56_29150 [Candidatus Sulfopaludibacter sp.]|nr:hypothetical protein [Candidatus Sulfopaludibacter sp.]